MARRYKPRKPKTLPGDYLPGETCIGCNRPSRAAFCDSCAPPGPEVGWVADPGAKAKWDGIKTHRRYQPKSDRTAS